MKLTFARKLILGLVCASMALLSGCSTTNPYTGQQQVSDATLGTGIGAIGGAGIGALLGGGRGALIGGALGAVTGGLVGNSFDQENAELRRMLVGTGVQVVQTRDGIQLVMMSDVTFRTGQSYINEDFFPVLDSVSVVIKKYNRTTVIITGYTDNVGNDAFNQTLSENRAATVGSYLISRGISPNRVFTQGMGKRDPIASNSTPSGRSMNRRVVINLRPMS
jgi:outer membrane protein OmpA-like peptidoglycan-associated protein